MSETTNLQLKKHDNVSTNTNAFDIDNYLNGNWDKIDAAYGTMGANINAKYTKPVGGIPKTDLDSSVQTSLGKADTAIQTHQDISGKEDKSNKVTSISSESTNTQYPSAKLLYDKLAEKQTEIDNLQTDVEDLRNASYKVPGTGTDITLENTSENKFVEFGLEGRTEQEQLTGKNLVNVFDENAFKYGLGSNNTTVELNGTIITTSNFASGRNKGILINNLEQNTDYVVSLVLDSIVTSSTQKYVEVEAIAYNADNTINSAIFQQSFNTVGSTIQKTFNSGTFDKIAIHISGYYDVSATGTTTYHNLMVEKGSTATSYEPYCGGIPAPNPRYEYPIKNVTGNANVKIQNKNLAKTTDCNITKTNATFKCNNGLIEVNTNSANYSYDICGGIITGNYLPISYANANDYYLTGKDKGTYKLSFPDLEATITGSVNSIVAIYTNQREMKCYIPPTAIIYGTTSFTLQEGEYVKSIYIWTNYTNSITNIKTHIQLEQGSTATSYVPHQEQNYPFTFAEGQRGMEGTQLNDDGIHNIRKQYAITGNETWELFDNICVRIRKNDIKGMPDTATLGDIKCNYLVADTQVNIQTGVVDYGIAIRQEGANGIVVRNKDFTTLEQYTNWFKQLYNNNAPLLIEYPLAESELENNIISYNETQQAQYNAIKQARSYDDITYITSTSDELGFDMNVVAVADANKVIDSLDTRLLALESEV